MNKLRKHPILSCIIIFLICVIARIIEYFIIRTDETILSENFLHKVFGIILLIIILKYTQLKWSDIGFTKQGILVSEEDYCLE